eukprot:1305800-Rhodomonas_salina.4
MVPPGAGTVSLQWLSDPAHSSGCMTQQLGPVPVALAAARHRWQVPAHCRGRPGPYSHYPGPRNFEAGELVAVCSGTACGCYRVGWVVCVCGAEPACGATSGGALCGTEIAYGHMRCA